VGWRSRACWCVEWCMAKLVVGVIVFACASVVLVGVGQYEGGGGASGIGSGEVLRSSSVMLAFSASARRSRVSQVFLVHEEGSTIQLTHGRLHLEIADWSPDAKQILVVAAAGSSEALAEVSATTGRVRLIRRFDGSIRDAAWSPTNDRIAFELNGHPFTVNRRGHDLHDLAPTALHNINEVTSGAHGVSWAPDGSLIAGSAILPCGARILVSGPRPGPANVSGDCPRSRSHATYDDVEPTWSPNGGQITFTRHRRHRSSSVYHVNLSGGPPTRYRLGELGGCRSPAWSPLAAEPPMLAFRNPLGVYIYDPRRATTTRLGAIAPLTGPLWSADATRVAYFTDRRTFNSSPELVIAGTDGSPTLRINHFSQTYPDLIGQPAWRPSTQPS
jgi:dipeptidyl aminopeptidase/acylaminoacyl peptidase